MTAQQRQGNIEIPTDLFNEILPGLFMGGTSEVQTIDSPQALQYFSQDHDFDCVVTLYAWAAPVNWGVEERRYGFPDGPINVDVLPKIEELAAWAFSKWQAGSRVNIRCQAGLNRSGLVTALVLRQAGKSSTEAINLIRAHRSEWALCNDDFVEYLLSLDEQETK